MNSSHTLLTDVSNTVNAYLAFRAAIRAVRRHNRTASQAIETVLCPGLGPATGRVPPQVCAAQMLHAYRTSHLGQPWHFDNLSAAIDLHEDMR